MKHQKTVLNICKSLIGAFLITALLLAGLALLLWKFDISKGIMKIAMLALYILSAGAGGMIIGKKQREKKFLWGLLVGALYFGILVLMNILSGGLSGIVGRNLLTIGIICTMSGTLGGMLA